MCKAVSLTWHLQLHFTVWFFTVPPFCSVGLRYRSLHLCVLSIDRCLRTEVSHYFYRIFIITINAYIYLSRSYALIRNPRVVEFKKNVSVCASSKSCPSDSQDSLHNSHNQQGVRPPQDFVFPSFSIGPFKLKLQ